MRYLSPNIIKAKVAFLFLPSLALTCLFAIGSLWIVTSFLLPAFLPAYHTSVIHVIRACAGMETMMVKHQCS